jgi:hypothetical protein
MEEYKILKGRGGLPDRYVRGEVELNIPPGTKVETYPVLSGDSKVTEYFGVVLDTPLAIAPSSEMTVYANLASDTGVFLSGGGKYRRIDTISRWPKKFALYGNASDGMVYRHFKAGYSSSPPKPERDKVLAGLKIVNHEDEWITMGRCLIDQRHYNLFYSGKDVVGELIEIQVMNDDLSIVRLRNRPSLGKGRAMPYMPAGIINVLEMRFGL